jgi:4-hydroxy-tetrahydrodipicolinate synthase
MPVRSLQLRGVVPAVVTPFSSSGEIDVDALRRITGFLIARGVHAIMTVGGTGEFPLLDRAERKLVTEVVAVEAAGRVPVIAGIGACATRDAIVFARDAAAVGAHAVIMTPPYYFPLPDTALLAFYRAVAAESLPLVAYNNPTYTGNNLSPRLIAQLVEDGAIFAVKQSNSNLGELVEVLRLTEGRVPVLTGIDSQFVSSLAVGASGVFSTAAAAVPDEVVGIYDAFSAGDLRAARARQIRLQVLNRFFEYEPGYVAPCKEVLALQGLCGRFVRAPMPELTEGERAEIAAAFRSLQDATTGRPGKRAEKSSVR